MRRVPSKFDHLTFLWAVSICVPLTLIFGYAVRWIFVRPRATDLDRIAFIAACAMTCVLIFASTAIRERDRRRRRVAGGLCVHCGYDLRGSPGRCPECGTPR